MAMRTRHRIPMLFTLSMLDVFCCALGCVILLWLWNDRLAKISARSFEDSSKLLDSTRVELTSARATIDTLNEELAKVRGKLVAVTGERDRTRTELTGARDQVAALTRQRDKTAQELDSARENLEKLDGELTRSRTAANDLNERLARAMKDKQATAGELASLLEKKKKDDEALTNQAATARKRVAELELLMRNRDKELTAASAKSKGLEDQLHDLEGQLKLVKTRADAAAALQQRLEEENKRLAASDARIKDLEKNLTGRKSILVEMQGELDKARSQRQSLADELAKLRIAADNRFAGIQLTGRRVVFLVDMSGSMKMSDPRTEAKDKWSTVTATLIKVMRSLPDLEKFQVILFGEGTSVPVGSADDWLDYDAATSSDRIARALARVEPTGNTNMYAAFDLAFRFRPRGLDTIYLLSDGLPNVGPGLTPLEQTRTMSDTEKGEILGRYIRHTLRESWNRLLPGQPPVRVNSIGFFYESPDLGAFLWALAREHDGSFVGMSKP